MKTASKTKNTSHTNSHSSQPFFNKSGEGTFFSKSKEVEKPFFTPSFIQPKLTINQPNDKYEQEADEMAEKVVQMPQKNIQRMCSDCEQEVESKQIMRKSNKSESSVSTNFNSQLKSSKGKGNALSNSTNQYMSNAFGSDFSNVRIHTDANAIQLNKKINARAFTYGPDIYFNQGEYSPNSVKGEKLLTHELTHTIQQKENSAKQIISRQSAGELVLPTTAAVASVPWSLFWKQVIKRFAIRGAAAAGLALIDGPLPIGDLIALGLTIWTIYEIISLWDVLWASAAEEMARCNAVKTECIAECTDELRGDGNPFPFFRCVNACMARHGC